MRFQHALKQAQFSKRVFLSFAGFQFLAVRYLLIGLIGIVEQIEVLLIQQPQSPNESGKHARSIGTPAEPEYVDFVAAAYCAAACWPLIMLDKKPVGLFHILVIAPAGRQSPRFPRYFATRVTRNPAP